MKYRRRALILINWKTDLEINTPLRKDVFDE